MNIITTKTLLSIGQYIGVQNDTSIRTKVKVHRIYYDSVEVEYECGAIGEFQLVNGTYRCDESPFQILTLVLWTDYYETTWLRMKEISAAYRAAGFGVKQPLHSSLRSAIIYPY